MQVDINEYAEGAILLDGLEEAIIGIVEELWVDRNPVDPHTEKYFIRKVFQNYY